MKDKKLDLVILTGLISLAIILLISLLLILVN